MLPSDNEIVEKHIQEMLAEGVISPSNSPWAAPVVLAPKKDGTIRFCVDYRALNEVTKKDVYTLPRVDEVLDALGNSKYRTTLDLVSGYWQTPVHEEDREKTAFITRSGLYEFNVMPFGLTGAPPRLRYSDMSLPMMGCSPPLMYWLRSQQQSHRKMCLKSGPSSD